MNFVHPRGAWSEPIDLNLHDASLAGISVETLCLDDTGVAMIDDSACKYFRNMMASLGATVVEPQPEDSPVSDDKVERGKTPADILVVYRDIDRSTGACGWLLIPFVMSGTLFPCFADATSKAQVTVTDIKDGRTTTWPLEVRIRRYAGLGALPLLAMDSLKALPRRQFHKQLAHNFAQFVRNKTYTAAVLRDGAP